MFFFQMCNRLPEMMKNGDVGIFPVYYSLEKQYEVLVCSTFLFFLIKSVYMKGHFVYGILRSAGNHFRGSRTPLNHLPEPDM